MEKFCQTVGTAQSPIFWQYIGDYVLKEITKIKYPISNITVANAEAALTYEERNGLHYAAGYVPRSLKPLSSQLLVPENCTEILQHWGCHAHHHAVSAVQKTALRGPGTVAGLRNSQPQEL